MSGSLAFDGAQTPLGEDDKHRSPLPSRAPSENEKAVKDMFANASSATDKEHNMTLKEGLRLYPKAIAWSALISTLCAMEGYDVSLIGNFCE
jgi:SP family general alpha glucoside:H+ symporter-like MFS transporter